MKRLFHPDPWQRNVWVTVIAELLTMLGFQAGFVFIPYYIQEMGLTDLRAVSAWTGIYQSLGSIGFAVFTPIWGIVGDRYGRKLMLVRAFTATALVFTLTGLARNPTQLIIVRVIQGCTTGTPAAASALVATSAPKERMGYSLGLVQTAIFIGSSLGPMFGGFVADIYGYRLTFFFSAMLVVVAVLLVIAFVQEPERSANALSQAQRENPFQSLRDLIISPRVILLITTVGFINLGYGLLGPVFPIFIQQIVTNPERLASAAGTITGVAASSAAVSALVVGRLSDTIGHRRVLLSCMTGMAALYIPLAFCRSIMTVGVLRGVQGFFQGGISPSTSAMVVGSAPPEKTGAVLGLSNSIGSVGFAVGPLLGALLLSATSTRTVFLISAVTFMLIAAAVAVADRARFRQVSRETAG